MRTVKKDEIENYVLDRLLFWIQDDFVLNTLADGIVEFKKEESPYILQLEANKAKVQKKMDNIMKPIENVMDFYDFRERYTSLRDQREQIAKELADEKYKNPIFTKEEVLIYQFNLYLQR